MDLQTFVMEYNKLVDYNFDILKSIGFENIESLKSCKYIYKIVNDYMCFNKITEEDYDYETAEIYEYPEKDGKQTFELQIHGCEECGTAYFWVTRPKSEEEYRNEKIKTIFKNIDAAAKETFDKMSVLNTELNELLKYKEIIFQKLL